MLDIVFSKKKIVSVVTGIITGILLLVFLYRIKLAVFPFIFGVLFSFLFNPFIKHMKERNFSREGAVLLLLIIVFNVIFISGLFFFPLFIEELIELTEKFPQYMTEIAEFINDINKSYEQIQLPEIVDETIDQVLEEIEMFVMDSVHLFMESLISFIPYILSLFLSPIITYYILRDFEEIKKYFSEIIPDERKNICKKLAKEINDIFVGYFRGQIWISIFVAVLGVIGLYFMRVRFYLILGILAGLTNLIPYIGPIVGATPAVLITFIDSPLKSLLIIILYVIIQQIESSLIAPKILSENVGIHPLTVIFSLLAGAQLFGFWGMIFAIPISAILKVLFKMLVLPAIKDRLG